MTAGGSLNSTDNLGAAASWNLFFRCRTEGEFFPCIPWSIFLPQYIAAFLDPAESPPVSRGKSEYLFHQTEGRNIALCMHQAGVFVLQGGASVPDHPDKLQDGAEQICGLKAAHDARET